eukprot:CAMPEP_0185032484 /NCGR_PEP_ID=MMETSP1103-20130426/20598_1 /TAXON_ID=36769 /ORGANISM="Paraphysomonas bandaiensis, Strain Caron Lab Isolate" /LENGTH=123 /DNA_ID=CAMNT_0027568405 /DNA_START=394 /DNA_END=761 /DNA_ORIENTATION=+
MLIGAGGNAGNQAAVKVIREIALEKTQPKWQFVLILQECGGAIGICVFVGLAGCLRVFLSPESSLKETGVITTALVLILFISIFLGSVLPFVMLFMGVDPAHGATSVQVLMDIVGVLVLCLVA